MHHRLLAALLACTAMAAAMEPVLIKASAGQDLSGGDDLARLRLLAGGVGWEFAPDATTTAALKRIGISTMRCINVDPLEGAFSADGGYAVGDAKLPANRFLRRLHAHLDTCRQIGAAPHIVFGTGMPKELRLSDEALATAGVMGQGANRQVYGPTDPQRYVAYLAAYITYVMVDQGFADARFEYGNEPDIRGQFPFPAPPLPGMGSRALFEGYLANYLLAAEAADRVQRQHPGLRVRLGGPGLAWAYTYRFGDMNWAVRFIEVCAERKARLDFLSLHLYGNIADFDGAMPSDAAYPTYGRMLEVVLAARAAHRPGLPIWITEWGPSYHSSGNPSSQANNNSLGAAWSIALLDRMAQAPIDGALYLATTDMAKPKPGGGWDNVWGWPTLFTNPNATGTALPKATFHALEMLSRLRGRRVEATRPGQGIGCIAAADPATRALRVLAWNLDARLPESAAPIDRSVRRSVPIQIVDAADFFAAPRMTATTWLVSASHGDVHAAYRAQQPLEPAAAAAAEPAATATAAIIDGRASAVLDLPPSSVALIEFSPLTTAP